MLSPGAGARGISVGNAAVHLVVTAAVNAAAIVASGSSLGGPTARAAAARTRRRTASTAEALVHSALWYGLLAAQLGSVKAYDCDWHDHCEYEECKYERYNGYCVRTPKPGW